MTHLRRLLRELLHVVLAEVALAGVVAREYIRRGLVFGHGYERGLVPEFVAGRLSDPVADFCEVVDEVARARCRGPGNGTCRGHRCG